MTRLLCKLRVLAGVLLVAMAIPAAGQDLVVVGARVYPAPDAAPLEDATVWIRDGWIVHAALAADRGWRR